MLHESARVFGGKVTSEARRLILANASADALVDYMGN